MNAIHEGEQCREGQGADSHLAFVASVTHIFRNQKSWKGIDTQASKTLAEKPRFSGNMF